MANTPKGTLTGFVAIQTASTKYKSEGEYSCSVEFTKTEATEMKKAIDELMTESLKETKGKSSARPPYRIEGKKLIVKFKQRAMIKTRTGDVWEKEVKVFDAAAKLVEEDLMIGEGSTVIINYSPYFWNVASQGGAGVTMQMEMVQIIDLKKRSGGGGKENPFEATDGFTAAKKDTVPFTMEDVEDDDMSGDF